MKIKAALSVLRNWDEGGRYVFTRQHLARLFPDDEPKAFAQSLNRLVHDGILMRACRGVYVNPFARSRDQYLLERVAVFMRRGQYSYVSLESALSEYGAISQVLMDRLTIMTTGRKGVYRTPFGVIEFTHTKRSFDDVLQATRQHKGRPLRVATLATAWRDLKRAGRNTTMVDRTVLAEIQDG